MRTTVSLSLLAAVALVGCTGAQQVSSTPPTYNPPTVSYSITTGDLTDANMKAASYCQRYGGSARLVSAVGGQATYQCVGGSTGTVAVPPAVAPAPTVVTPVPSIGQALPTVSYPAPGNDISSANAQAMNYCRQLGRSARFQSVSNNTAYYTCL